MNYTSQLGLRDERLVIFSGYSLLRYPLLIVLNVVVVVVIVVMYISLGRPINVGFPNLRLKVDECGLNSTGNTTKAYAISFNEVSEEIVVMY